MTCGFKPFAIFSILLHFASCICMQNNSSKTYVRQKDDFYSVNEANAILPFLLVTSINDSSYQLSYSTSSIDDAIQLVTEKVIPLEHMIQENSKLFESLKSCLIISSSAPNCKPQIEDKMKSSRLVRHATEDITQSNVFNEYYHKGILNKGDFLYQIKYQINYTEFVNHGLINSNIKDHVIGLKLHEPPSIVFYGYSFQCQYRMFYVHHSFQRRHEVKLSVQENNIVPWFNPSISSFNKNVQDRLNHAKNINLSSLSQKIHDNLLKKPRLESDSLTFTNTRITFASCPNCLYHQFLHPSHSSSTKLNFIRPSTSASKQLSPSLQELSSSPFSKQVVSLTESNSDILLYPNSYLKRNPSRVRKTCFPNMMINKESETQYEFSFKAKSQKQAIILPSRQILPLEFLGVNDVNKFNSHKVYLVISTSLPSCQVSLTSRENGNKISLINYDKWNPTRDFSIQDMTYSRLKDLYHSNGLVNSSESLYVIMYGINYKKKLEQGFKMSSNNLIEKTAYIGLDFHQVIPASTEKILPICQYRLLTANHTFNLNVQLPSLEYNIPKEIPWMQMKLFDTFLSFTQNNVNEMNI